MSDTPLSTDDRVAIFDVAVELDHAINAHRRALDDANVGKLSGGTREALLDSALAIATVLRSLQRRPDPLPALGPDLDVVVPITVLWTLQNSMLVLYDGEIGNQLALTADELEALAGPRLAEWIVAVGRLAEADDVVQP